MGEKGSKAGTGPQDDKARRLAEALRENLRRRKAQSRARASETKAGDKGETSAERDR